MLMFQVFFPMLVQFFSLPILFWSVMSSSGSVYGFSSSSSNPALIHRSFMICCKKNQNKNQIETFRVWWTVVILQCCTMNTDVQRWGFSWCARCFLDERESDFNWCWSQPASIDKSGGALKSTAAVINPALLFWKDKLCTNLIQSLDVLRRSVKSQEVSCPNSTFFVLCCTSFVFHLHLFIYFNLQLINRTSTEPN